MNLKKSYVIFIGLFSLSLCTLGCSSGEFEDIMQENKKPVTLSSIPQYALEIGKFNAVKKAYQMTDLQFTPLNPIGYNNGTFEPGITYKGVIYSSTREIETFVGNDISFHTLMTAIHNPRSKIYTEDISKPPYHGTNCRAYYGSVCSSFVSHALGIETRYWANDFPISEKMQEIDFTLLENLQVADVLWRDGHVAMITDIQTDENGQVTKIEISESIGAGCRRYYRSRTQFMSLMNTSFKKIFRYTELYKNTEYTPVPQFVTVMGESPVMFKYNDDLCVDKGDKSCYLEDEDVIVNIMRDYEYLEVYRDGKPYTTIKASSEKDVILSRLPFGNYKARLRYESDIDTSIDAPTMGTRSAGDSRYSDYTYWKVVNTSVFADRTSGRIFFSSANATPLFVRFCDIYGNGGSLTTNNLYILSDNEIRQGYFEVPQDKISSEYPYIRVIFQTEYAKIINTPINWFR